MALGGIMMAGYIAPKAAGAVGGGIGASLLGGYVGRSAGATMFGGGSLMKGAGTGMGAGLGLVGYTTGKIGSALMRGTELTNPMFNNVTGQAYGKRGIDANNNNTRGLVQSLHSNRRRPR